MSDCTVNKMYESIDACPGKKVIAGIKRRVYFIPKSDIANWPKLPDVGSEDAKKMGDLATYVGNFTLKAEAYWRHFDLKDNSSGVTWETAGEIGSQIVNNQATLVMVGPSKEIIGFQRQCKNDDLVYVVQEKDGGFHVLGNKDIYATDSKPSGDLGTEITGAKTCTVAIQVYDDCPAPYYEGDLLLSKDTKLNCATGEEEAVPAA